MDEICFGDFCEASTDLVLAGSLHAADGTKTVGGMPLEVFFVAMTQGKA